ncbi:MAG: ABC transporter ATP-binding protein [Candidatus Schekmanbacteria bacterium]|nr:ABC transporter ATP-binding protein [Candidatus Schekmanbacteria bacterium]
MNFIEIKNIKKKYTGSHEEVFALNGVNVTIDDGEFVSIMGQSGSGKSTLLSVLGGLNHPSGGNVLIDEMDIYSLSNEQIAAYRSEYLGFVFQDFNLIPYLNVIENVMLPLAIQKGSKAEKSDKALRVLAKVGLEKKIERLPNQLSGGEQERVAIARAIVNDPPIILADEPTGNLDTGTSNEIMAVFDTLNKHGHTIIMVTHNPENATHASRKIVILDGKIKEN